jgi:hypothetical protein
VANLHPNGSSIDRADAIAGMPRWRIKTQSGLPFADTAAMLFWALLASG